MESKVNRALLLQQFLASFAHARQNAIDDGNFTNAMTHHFFWLLHTDEYVQLVRSMTEQEQTKFMLAKNCFD